MVLQAYDSAKLFPMRPSSFRNWERMFHRASTVHFFSKRTNQFKVVDDPRYNAYALLGPRYCPTSYNSVKSF